MTEKRFVLIEFEEGNLIFDDPTGKQEYFNSAECMQDNEIVECLNNLHEENLALKQQNQELKMIIEQDVFAKELNFE